MTHEFKKMMQALRSARQEGQKAVMASVVALEGSSYRRPGVRMLILEGGETSGAVSGGCVEKEIIRQSQAVFMDGKPRMMTYDGRYRLGCEGILHILIEPCNPSEAWLTHFFSLIETRREFTLLSYYTNGEMADERLGTELVAGGDPWPLRSGFSAAKDLKILKQPMAPCFKLLILGSEHDAVQLCGFAALSGWEVTVVASLTEEKTIRDFPGARDVLSVNPEEFSPQGIDDQTAVMLMTHSYVKDLTYLLTLQNQLPAYLGVLGPASRREKLLTDLIERCPDINEELIDRIHGPAGLNIGAETPQEIAIAILSEILAVVREKQPMLLKNKKGPIHST